MASIERNNSDSSMSEQSEDDSEYNFIQNFVFESEFVGSTASEVKEPRGGSYQPYSNEPIADEEWLLEYYAEKQRENERFEELKRRHDGLETTDSW